MTNMTELYQQPARLQVRPDEADVRQSWWSAKADSLTAEVVRLQTKTAEADECHSVALQVTSA